MVLSSAELVRLLQHEVKILVFLAGRATGAARDYRPAARQRSTTELLRYLSMMGPELMTVARTGVFDGAAWGAAERAVAGRGFDEAVAAIAAQAGAYAAQAGELTDEYLRADIAPWGESMSRGRFIVQYVLCGYSAYRTQLFLYLKASGHPELGTTELWDGSDPPAKA